MKKVHKNILVIILVAVVTALIAGFIVLNGLPEGISLPGITQAGTTLPATAGSDPAQSEDAVQTEQVLHTEPQTEYAALEFPIVLENGNLEIESFFCYTGMNPDDENIESKNIAAISLINRSGEYLDEARITLALTSGAEANFVVTDLPAGKCAMAFCVDSTAATELTGCTEVRCEASFDPDASMQTDRVAVSVEAMTVTVKNLTGSDIPELVIYCRCPLGDDYFGGITYQYPLNNLPANGTATVDAWDCVLGMAEVVRIEIKE